MTYGEGRRKVYELLDEYTSGGTVTEDEDIRMKLPELFDIAQKRLSQIARVVKERPVEREDGVTEYALPEDMQGIYRVWRDDRIFRGYRIRGGKLIIPTGDTAAWNVEYFATPATISEETTEDADFELTEEACQCMPFFVAGMVLSSDLVQDANIYLGIYAQMVAELNTELPGANVRARQSLYRR